MSTVRHYVDLNEHELIATVQQYKILYDRTLKGYKKPVERENAWLAVGEQINFPAAECKKRWRSLRDAFMKQHRWILKGNKSVKKKTWLFFNQMQFLTPYITHTAQSAISDDYDDSSNAELKETKLEIEDIKYLPNDENIEEDAEEEEHLYDTNELIHFPLDEKNDQNDVSMNNTVSQSAMDPLSAGLVGTSKLTKEVICKDQELKLQSAASVAHFDLLDSNDQFLLSCSPILKRLPKRKNSLVRMKIQKLLYDIEFDSENISD